MTANGTEISDGASLSGSQVLRVYGTNLTPPYFSLWFNGVEYTPLDYGDGYVEYVLQDNGTYEIRNENDIVMEFEIEGIVIPSELGSSRGMGQSATVSTNWTNSQNKQATSGNCINYPRLFSESLPYFVMYNLCTAHEGESDYTLHNCSFDQFIRLSNDTGDAYCISVENANEIAYIEFKGFIIAVFNYTTTPQP